MMIRDSFIFYRSFYEALKDLPRDIQGEIYTAIMEYSLYGMETENLKPISRTVFTLIKPQLDANISRYENGKKGGRPKQEETKDKPNGNQNKTNSKANKNDNVNDNVNGNKNDNDLSDASGEAKTIDEFLQFQKWISVNTSNVAKMQEPFTEDQYYKIKERFTGKLVKDILTRMHNWKDLKKKNVSAYLTFLNWASKETKVKPEKHEMIL